MEKQNSSGYLPIPDMRRFNSSLGFSLIEVVGAVVILIFILSGTLGIFWQGLKIAVNSQKRTIAYSLAREKIEENYRWPLINGEFNENYGQIPDFPEFRRFTSIQEYLGVWQLKLIYVKIYWNNDAVSQSFETLKANY